MSDEERRDQQCLQCLIIFTVSILWFIVIYNSNYFNPSKEAVGWEMNVTLDTSAYILPERVTTLFDSKKISEDLSFNIVIVVSSAPPNAARRNAIRETWASQNISFLKVVFLLGRPTNAALQVFIEEEVYLYKDVVQEDFIDSYNNLSVKSVMMLKWFLQKCPFTQYLMKTDDDTYVHLSNLFSLLTQEHSSILIGTRISNSTPARNVYNKWYVPKYMYKPDHYPDYLAGFSYIMSRDIAAKLYEAALSTSLVLIEDVYITGICALKAGVLPKNSGGFIYFPGKIDYNKDITNHGLLPDELRSAWAWRPYNFTVN